MSKKHHEKQLAQSRARRDAARRERRGRRRILLAAAGVIVLVAAIVGASMLFGDDDPDETAPTGEPSVPATVSAAPTTAPSAAPSRASAAPTTGPSSAPAVADGPCPAPTDAPTPDTSLQYDQPPPADDVADTVTATITTTCGDITVELDGAAAPQTVANFAFLAEEGYYVGTPFHRVMADFVIQGGDPTGTGSGGPGYSFDDELDLAEEVVAANEGLYPRGTVAMANSGPDSNGSQFFVVQDDPGYAFPPDYAVFGTVVDGMDVVDDIANGPVTGPGNDQAVDPTVITRIAIEES